VTIGWGAILQGVDRQLTRFDHDFQAEDRAPSPGERRERDAVLVGPEHCDLERSVAEAPESLMPTSRRAPSPLASSRRVREVRGDAAADEGDEAAAGGAIGGVNDQPEGQALVVRGSWSVSSCCWSLPEPAGGNGRLRRRRNGAVVSSPGEWARRSLRGRASRSGRGNSGERQTGGAARRMGGTE
jgi:hypothetical protein